MAEGGAGPSRRSERPRRTLSRLLALLLVSGSCPTAAERIVVGSKNFAENRLLAEMFAQLIESRSELQVKRRLGLAGTEFCFSALREGAIDLYPEYTGTGLVTLLGLPSRGSATDTLRMVRSQFLARWNLWWLGPLGFENAYELAVPRELAEREGLRTITDLARISESLRAGFGYEFVERRDGLPGLAETYGIAFRNLKTMLQAPKYQAAGEGEIDVLDVYTTDGRLLVYDLLILEDDREFFPPYQAAPLVRGQTLEEHPEVGSILSLLGDALDGERMRSLNLRLQEEKEPVKSVARRALSDLGLAESRELEPMAPRAGLLPYFWSHRATLGRLVLEHLFLCLAALGLGIAVALPIGLALESRRHAAEPAIRVIATSQTIPSLALLGFLIPLLGVGVRPTIVALWIYSIFPILRNTYSGLRDASPDSVEAATALGMTGAQVLWQVRLPLATPTIMAGIRTAAVITVGTATLAAFIGGGGLGEPIIAGVQLVDTTQILFGAIPAALLAVVVDLGLGVCERMLRPAGLATGD